MQNSTTTYNAATALLLQQQQKNLRRAEARHRIELLQEAALLHGHLEDFWDDSLDLRGRRATSDMRLYAAELKKILGPDTQGLGERVEKKVLTTRSNASADLSRAPTAPADDALTLTHYAR